MTNARHGSAGEGERNTGWRIGSIEHYGSFSRPRAFLAAALFVITPWHVTARAGGLGAVGDLYVSGYSSHNVVQFDGQTGAFVGEFVSSPGGLTRAAGLAFGPNGNLFVCRYSAHSVHEYDGSTGAFIQEAIPGTRGQASGFLDSPKRLLFTADGRLLVAGHLNDAILAYDAATFEWLGTFAIGGPSPGGLDGPAGLTLGPNGNIYVTHGPVTNVPPWTGHVFEYHFTTGRLQRVVASGLDPSAWGAQLGPNGNLWLVTVWGDTATQSMGKLLQLDAVTGSVVTTADVDRPRGLLLAPTGDVLVAHQSEVLEFDGATGQLMGTFASSGSLLNAEGMAFKPPPPPAMTTPTVSGVSVSALDACQGSAGVTVTGTNLDAANTRVMLKNPDQPLGANGLVATYVGVVTGGSGDGASLNVDFDFDGGARMAGGMWDLEVRNPDGQADTLGAAVEVSPCWLAGDSNLFVLGFRHRATTKTYGVFEFDGGTGEVIGLVVEDRSGPAGNDLGCIFQSCPEGLLFGQDGDLLVSSVRREAVLKYDGITGRSIGAFIPAGAGGMMEPHRLTLAPSGNVLVVHGPIPYPRGVLEFDGLTGAFVRTVVPLGSCGLDNAGQFEFGADGTLYVSDWGGGGGSEVFAFDALTGACVGGGPLFTVPAPPPGIADRLYTGLTFGPDDGLLYVPVWDSTNGGVNQAAVWSYDPVTGQRIGEPLPMSTDLLNSPGGKPGSVGFGPNGHLFVADWSSPDRLIETAVSPTQGTIIGPFAELGNSSGTALIFEFAFKPQLGDADCDWDHDAADFAALQVCFGGDGVTPADYNCLRLDHDRDADVDLDDAAEFTAAMTGPE